jgi:hypothetical protein
VAGPDTSAPPRETSEAAPEAVPPSLLAACGPAAWQAARAQGRLGGGPVAHLVARDAPLVRDARAARLCRHRPSMRRAAALTPRRVVTMAAAEVSIARERSDRREQSAGEERWATIANRFANDGGASAVADILPLWLSAALRPSQQAAGPHSLRAERQQGVSLYLPASASTADSGQRSQLAP